MNAYENQKKFCEENNFPLFAPKDKCYSCGKDIWQFISPEEASWKLITTCPSCRRSFCD